MDEQDNLQQRFSIREEKREKRNQVVINAGIRDALEKYLAAYPKVNEEPSHFLFFSSKRNGLSSPNR